MTREPFSRSQTRAPTASDRTQRRSAEEPLRERRACVLVAEDEDRVRELAINVLDAYGFEAVGARHGGEALSMVRDPAAKIDAVMLDLSMPVVDGMTVLSELRREHPQLPIVVTSGYEASAGEMETPAVTFLAKPYRADQLITRLRALLADREKG